MATLHLELDIDSDVHPELFVRLASIERSPARQEKLRQLAATGLIWEIARLHGPAFSAPEVVTLAAAPGRVDGPGPAVDAGSASDHAAIVPEDVPLLVDVVDEAEIAGAGAADAAPAPAGSPDTSADDAARRPWTPQAPLIPPPPPEVPEAPEAPGGRTRSARIKRMKESGLFQNG